MGKNGQKSCRRWLLPAALVLAGAAWFENFTLSSSTVEVRSAALPAAVAPAGHFCAVMGEKTASGGAVSHILYCDIPSMML